MNKKFLSLIVLGAFAGTVLYCAKRRQFKECVNEYNKGIAETLDKARVTDFESFSDYLLEYYGIIAKNTFGNVVEYSSSKPKSNRIITSDDIFEYGISGYGYDMSDLEKFFSYNRALQV